MRPKTTHRKIINGFLKLPNGHKSRINARNNNNNNNANTNRPEHTNNKKNTFLNIALALFTVSCVRCVLNAHFTLCVCVRCVFFFLCARSSFKPNRAPLMFGLKQTVLCLFNLFYFHFDVFAFVFLS